jgi:hypothetical protein
MAGDYLKQYKELEKDFISNNKSPKTVKAFYDLLREIENNRNGENEILLSYINSSLGYYQKAYDIYKEIYEKNKRKAKTKLLELEQKARLYGDKLAVKEGGKEN